MRVLQLRIILLGFALILFSLPNFSYASEDFNKLTGLIFQKDLQGVKDMLACGMDVNIRQEQSGATPLIVACSMEGTEEIVKFLLSKGADIKVKGAVDGRTPLIWAAGNSMENTKLLIAKGADVKAKGVEGMTALIQSIFGIISGSVTTEICDVLLEKGANINAKLTGKDATGWTALLFAAKNEKPDLVKYLILKGADVNHQDNEGMTALMLAAKDGDKETVTVLLENKAKINLKNKEGETALAMLIKKQKAATNQKPEKKHKRDEVIKLLKGKGAK